MEMGFSARKARAALERSDGDATRAVEWLLSQPSSPGGPGEGSDEDDGDDSDGEGEGDDVRPPSPSSGSPPLAKKSLGKKSKPLKPQNPVFDQEAFTPVLIPAKPGAIVVANDPKAWATPPAGDVAFNGGEGWYIYIYIIYI